MSFTSVLIGSGEKPKRSFRWSLVSVRLVFSVSRFSYVTLLTTYLATKTMFKVSNRNTRKRCQKITLKTSERRDLTTRICTNLQSEVCFQFCFQVWRPVISTILNPFMSFYQKSLPKYLIHENSKCQHFFISEKTAPKTDKFFNFLPYVQRDAISVSQS